MGIGFIGLGNIGKPMARRMRALGGDIWVYDIFPEPVAELVALGFNAALSPRQLAQSCDIIRLCVRSDADVDALLYGADGILENAPPGALILIHSTVTQANVLRWHRDAKTRSLQLIDAPMTGGAAVAEAGTLCYMVGGEAAAVERCRPVLATSGSKIIHAGSVGAGIALKLCNNLMTYAALVAMHEATKLAEACGLPSELLHEVGQANGVVTGQMHTFITGRTATAAHGGAAAVEQVFGGHAALGKKDRAAALESAEKLGVSMPGTRCTHQLIEGAFLDRY
jgi:3-hydroxyisobutyrate dehydrogenase